MKRFVFVIAALLIISSWAATASAQSTELNVLSFNVLGGGGTAEVSAIAASGADIIGIQEGGSSTANMAGALGLNYHILSNSQRGSSNGIITRFDISATYDNGVKVDMGAGLGDAYIFSAHLASSPYQPYQLHPLSSTLGYGSSINTGSLAGDAAAAITAANAARSSQINVVLNEITTHVPTGAKVFLVGDFNEPSHLDWTAEAKTAGLHTHTVAWPTSIKVENAGFTDSYRELFPDETADLGYTWTTFNNHPEVHDRIDFVHYKGDGLNLTNVQLVGDFGSAGGVTSDIVRFDYPSDHRAVVSNFLLVPEPGTALLLGLGGVLIIRQRRG